MDRRTFVVAVATAASTAVAGCTGGATGGSSGGEEDRGDDTSPATTDAPATEIATGDPATGDPATGDPAISTRSFERTGDASEQSESASVTFGEGRITCTGVIRGKNGCMEASLESATYDSGTGTLRVRVTTTKEGGELCTQQVVYRGYEAVVGFDGGLPDRVVVEHVSMGGSRTMAETTR